jgi:two-component system cell cycle response regulator
VSLRTRLTAAFVAIVALPLLVAASIVAGSVPHISDDRTRTSVEDVRALAQARLQAACQRVVTAALLVAQSAATPDTAVLAATTNDVDAALLLDADGTPVAAAGVGLSASSGADAAAAGNGALSPYLTAPDCRTGGSGGPLVIAARVTLTGVAAPAKGAKGSTASALRGTAVAGLALAPIGSAPGILADLKQGVDAQVSLIAPGRSATDTASRGLASRLGRGDVPTGVVTVGHRMAAVVPLLGGADIVVSDGKESHGALYLVLGVAALVGIGLALAAGQLMARRATRPLSELSVAARRVAAGDLDTMLPEQRGTEVGELAVAFNHMTTTLRQTINDLRESHDELREGVDRLGSTLSGTHDLDRILQVILETGMTSAQAQAGALLLTSAAQDMLYLAAGHGLEGRIDGDIEDWRVDATWIPEEDPAQLPPPGVLARVASTGEIVHGVVGGPHGVQLTADEPRGRSILALPLRSAGRITGVLCLYDRSDGQPFEDRDIEVVRQFVSQATVAIDNVLMHREAQRLSVTDGLTGLWNYRYASLALEREVERAQRFGHPLSLIMLDLDRFKLVNDVHGHQRGDAVLVEVAARVRSVIREVDILARYGGEEMLLILPETDLAGAQLLAERVLDTVRSRPIGGPGEEPVFMTTSLGISVMPGHGTSPRTLLHAADSALYAAKSAGRDTARVADGQRGPSGKLRNPSDLLS